MPRIAPQTAPTLFEFTGMIKQGNPRMLSNDQIADQLDGLTFNEAKERLWMFDPWDRSAGMVLVMQRAPNAAEILKVFLEFGNSCGLHWPNRSLLARLLRGACNEVDLRDLMEPDARSFMIPCPRTSQFGEDATAVGSVVCSGQPIARSRGDLRATTISQHWSRRKFSSITFWLSSSTMSGTR
jgi:hypothetical protein